ncbi:efflux RND transporter periplasmic adaptor subunit [Patescibacteria group bacterium]
MAKTNQIYFLKQLKIAFKKWLIFTEEAQKEAKKKTRLISQKLTLWLRKRPTTSFFSLIALILFLIIFGNFLRDRQKTEISKEIPAKQATSFAIGQTPKIILEGQIEKAGTITVLAQVSGVVKKINIYHGQLVSQGQALVQFSSNYQGGNIPLLQRNLAYSQYQFNFDNFDHQKEIVDNQKELAEKSQENSNQLREIGRQAKEESQGQLQLNETILSSIEVNLSTLQSATQSAENDSLILSTQQLKSQFLSAVNQLKQLIRSTEYQSSDDESPAQLASLQKEIALKQLYVQEKSLELNLEVSRLNYQIARVAAALMSPGAPFKGTIERVHVRLGQMVSPGQPLVTLSGTSDQMKLVVRVSPKVAQKISKTETSTIDLPSGSIELMPEHITLEPILDGQHRVIFNLPLEISSQVFDGQFLSLRLPIGYPDSVSTIPSIPIDAVYQLKDEAYVYLAKENKAISQKIVLGQVLGGYVEVLEGLKNGDLLITSRNVNQDEPVVFNSDE